MMTISALCAPRRWTARTAIGKPLTKIDQLLLVSRSRCRAILRDGASLTQVGLCSSHRGDSRLARKPSQTSDESVSPGIISCGASSLRTKKPTLRTMPDEIMRFSSSMVCPCNFSTRHADPPQRPVRRSDSYNIRTCVAGIAEYRTSQPTHEADLIDRPGIGTDPTKRVRFAMRADPTRSSPLRFPD